jgi:hypothetical protein
MINLRYVALTQGCPSPLKRHTMIMDTLNSHLRTSTLEIGRDMTRTRGDLVRARIAAKNQLAAAGSPLAQRE